ncbi:uncharacterized protein EV422DRAFT_132638 [Fimicolochytrium jonesii]|uniref:uncharacterized protein n=1 Tax=Fimicolochytrium jonesii TaxID=1396493 RepID=UPI0022FEBE90|nr:uncharacterized protein EV422DRAFT_132638 [Fimicolochytrium jonesii]KAI8825593.1 hypothetical protein EV422DRAFT_132638 [Fimicolochytrium jonesii]
MASRPAQPLRLLAGLRRRPPPCAHSFRIASLHPARKCQLRAFSATPRSLHTPSPTTPTPPSHHFQSSNSTLVPAATYLATTSATDSFTPLPNRGFVAVDGPDAVKFLQGLTTNQMGLIERGGDGVFCAFLTAQGRVLYDAFIYPHNTGPTFPHPTFLIEHDARHTPALLLHLKRHKLRAKISITDVSATYTAWQIWGPATAAMWGVNVVRDEVVGGVALPLGALVGRERLCDIGCRDPRHREMGLRVVLETGGKPPLPQHFTKVPYTTYLRRRILLGIPEGADDFPTGVALPLESNLDLMSGVDFRKGCYLGQELTIRTYHTGVVRKRIVPVQYLTAGAAASPNIEDDDSGLAVDVGSETEDSEGVPPQTEIVVLPPSQSTTPSEQSEQSESDQQQQQQPTRRRRPTAATTTPKPIGRTGSHVANIGLALVRLEYVAGGKHHIQGNDGGGAVKDMEAVLAVKGMEVGVRAVAPGWWGR